VAARQAREDMDGAVPRFQLRLGESVLAPLPGACPYEPDEQQINMQLMRRARAQWKDDKGGDVYIYHLNL